MINKLHRWESERNFKNKKRRLQQHNTFPRIIQTDIGNPTPEEMQAFVDFSNKWIPSDKRRTTEERSKDDYEEEEKEEEETNGDDATTS